MRSPFFNRLSPLLAASLILSLVYGSYFLMAQPADDKPVQGFSFIKDRVSMAVKPGADKVTVPYFFENKTDRILTIKRYDSACSCLSAKVKGSKLKYAPGEKGEIRVEFKIENMTGKQEKTVLLWTTEDPADKPSTVMTVELDIPVLVEISPQNLSWKVGEVSTSKTIKIKVNNPTPIKITKHSGTNPNFAYTFKEIIAGKEYEVSVTPKSTEKPGIGMINLHTDSPLSRYKYTKAFVIIKR